MQTAIDRIIAVMLVLFQIIVAAIASIEGVLRSVLVPMGIGVEAQDVVLLVVAVVLIIGAIRFFGRIFAILITVVLLLLALHVLLPALGLATK